MRDRLHDVGEATDVVLVTFTDPSNLVAYSQTNELPFPILSDPDRRAYRAFGLGRGTIGRMYGWRAARRYLEIFRADGFGGLSRPTEDTLQLGGDFIVDAVGKLVYGFWGAGPDDRPSIDDLIAAIPSDGS